MEIIATLIIALGITVSTVAFPMIRHVANRPVNGEYKKVEGVQTHCLDMARKYDITPQKKPIC